jgi:hypothetical protein
MSYEVVKKMTISATPDHNFQMMGLHLLLLWKFSGFAGQICVEESSVVYLDYGDVFDILFSLVTHAHPPAAAFDDAYKPYFRAWTRWLQMVCDF